MNGFPDAIAFSPLPGRMGSTYLFERLVIDKARRVFGDLELAFLNLLTKLPGEA